MRLYKINVATGEAFELGAVGDYVRIRTSAVELKIENVDSGEQIEASQGDDFQFSPFNNLRISHTSGANQAVTLIISQGKKAGASQVSGSMTLAGQQGAFTSTQKTVTNASASMIAANAARRYLLIQNNDAAGDIYINLAGAAATTLNSIKIAAGSSYECQGYVPTGAVFAIGSIASNANIVAVEG